MTRGSNLSIPVFNALYLKVHNISAETKRHNGTLTFKDSSSISRSGCVNSRPHMFS